MQLTIDNMALACSQRPEPQTSPVKQIIAPTIQPIGRESIDSFSGAIHPSRTQHTTPALQVCLFPLLLLTMASPWEITPMGRKRKALRDPPGPR
jgi:hypothetical protein